MTGKPSLPRRRESIYSKVRSLWIPAFAGMTVLGCSSATIPPNSIISANPCIDAVLAEIATPGQIAAVSAYSHDAASASAPLGWARALPAVGITAEEIIAARPRLLLTGNYMSLSTRCPRANHRARPARLLRQAWDKPLSTSSFPRRRESIYSKVRSLWTPAFAGEIGRASCRERV